MVTGREAAAITGFSTSTIERAMAMGDLPFTWRQGRTARQAWRVIRRTDLAAWASTKGTPLGPRRPKAAPLAPVPMIQPDPTVRIAQLEREAVARNADLEAARAARAEAEARRATLLEACQAQRTADLEAELARQAAEPITLRITPSEGTLPAGEVRVAFSGPERVRASVTVHGLTVGAMLSSEEAYPVVLRPGGQLVVIYDAVLPTVP